MSSLYEVFIDLWVGKSVKHKIGVTAPLSFFEPHMASATQRRAAVYADVKV
jgi:hypothetical protein